MSSKSSLPDQLQRNLARSYIVERLKDPGYIDVMDFIAEETGDLFAHLSEEAQGEFTDEVYELITKARTVVKFYDER